MGRSGSTGPTGPTVLLSGDRGAATPPLRERVHVAHPSPAGQLPRPARPTARGHYTLCFKPQLPAWLLQWIRRPWMKKGQPFGLSPQPRSQRPLRDKKEEKRTIEGRVLWRHTCPQCQTLSPPLRAGRWQHSRDASGDDAPGTVRGVVHESTHWILSCPVKLIVAQRPLAYFPVPARKDNVATWLRSCRLPGSGLCDFQQVLKGRGTDFCPLPSSPRPEWSLEPAGTTRCPGNGSLARGACTPDTVDCHSSHGPYPRGLGQEGGIDFSLVLSHCYFGLMPCPR